MLTCNYWWWRRVIIKVVKLEGWYVNGTELCSLKEKKKKKKNGKSPPSMQKRRAVKSVKGAFGRALLPSAGSHVPCPFLTSIFNLFVINSSVSFDSLSRQSVFMFNHPYTIFSPNTTSEQPCLKNKGIFLYSWWQQFVVLLSEPYYYLGTYQGFSEVWNKPSMTHSPLLILYTFECSHLVTSFLKYKATNWGYFEDSLVLRRIK